ncbi:MAG: hypothetical protein QF722_06260 [Candidatus Thalassarchaeaceae archaeon]|jgi:hypothetical protein|nr:hypothetical protein [Candidatus Thalassarchaeaceae archaeon]MDP6845135.1 hypothetical protein [Candidatus Thalassarchaeaceae archaeon]
MRKGVTTLICLLMVAIMLSGCLEQLIEGESHEPGSRSIYRASDTASSPTDDGDDILISIRWDEAYEDLEWESVVMKLEVGDTLYACTITGEDCIISQDGDNDNLWETNEFLTISENNVDIVGSSGAIVNLYITYRSTLISGSDSVYVQ